MKHVALTLNGTKALIGQQAQSMRTAIAANGYEAANGDAAPFHVNTNDLPAAAPGAGVLGDTRISTPTGPCRIDALAPGDTVLDIHGNAAQILHVLTEEARCFAAEHVIGFQN